MYPFLFPDPWDSSGAPAQERAEDLATPSLAALPCEMTDSHASWIAEGKLDHLHLQSHLQHPHRAQGHDSTLLIDQEGLWVSPEAQNPDPGDHPETEHQRRHLGSSRYKFQRGVLTHTPETPTHKNTSEKGMHSYAMKTQNPLLRAHKAPFFSPLSFRFRRDQSQPRDQHSQLSRRLPSSNHGHFHHLPLPEAHRWHSTPRLRPARAPLLLLISLN